MENDLLEAIIALPNDIFYNTGIATYIWVLSNKKAGTKRAGKVQLIDANGLFESAARRWATNATTSRKAPSTPSPACTATWQKTTSAKSSTTATSATPKSPSNAP